MKPPAGIHPRRPFVCLRMTEAEARDLLQLLDDVDREGGIQCGMGAQVLNYIRIARRLRKARLHAPRLAV